LVLPEKSVEAVFVSSIALWQWTKTSTAKTLFRVSRWLHVYVSTALFAMLIFFSITGITLNHADWIDDDSVVMEQSLTLNSELIDDLSRDRVSALVALQDWLENETHLKNPRSLDVDWELGEIALDYPMPSGYVFVSVDVATGHVELESKYSGLWSLLNDLHKGRNTGRFWSLVIDVTALLICLFALTGMIILLQNKRYRVAGVVSVISGGLMPWIYYLLLVPSVN